MGDSVGDNPLEESTLISAGYDGAVRTWRAGSSDVAPWTLEAENQLLRGEGAVGVEGRALALAACCDGESVLCGSGEGTVHLLGPVSGPQGLQLLDSLPLASSGADGCRVGALAALPPTGGTGETPLAVAGTSDGRLVGD